MRALFCVAVRLLFLRAFEGLFCVVSYVVFMRCCCFVLICAAFCLWRVAFLYSAFV